VQQLPPVGGGQRQAQKVVRGSAAIFRCDWKSAKPRRRPLPPSTIYRYDAKPVRLEAKMALERINPELAKNICTEIDDPARTGDSVKTVDQFGMFLIPGSDGRDHRIGAGDIIRMALTSVGRSHDQGAARRGKKPGKTPIAVSSVSNAPS
jgi:hypothetical protein